MPRKSTTKRSSTRKRSQHGRGVMDVLNFVKNNHLISKGLGLIPHPGAQAAASVAGLVGLGRKRRKATTRKRRAVAVPRMKVSTRRRKAVKSMSGRGIFGDLGSGIGSVFGGLGHGLFGNGRPSKGNLSGRSRRIGSIIAI